MPVAQRRSNSFRLRALRATSFNFVKEIRCKRKLAVMIIFADCRRITRGLKRDHCAWQIRSIRDTSRGKHTSGTKLREIETLRPCNCKLNARGGATLLRFCQKENCLKKEENTHCTGFSSALARKRVFIFSHFPIPRAPTLKRADIALAMSNLARCAGIICAASLSRGPTILHPRQHQRDAVSRVSPFINAREITISIRSYLHFGASLTRSLRHRGISASTTNCEHEIRH